MSETLRINNLSATYVEKLRPNNIFYNNNFLLCGIFYINLYSYDTYKTLINFSLPNIDVKTIDKISLFAYVDNARIYNNVPFSFSISSAQAPFSIFTTNWNNQPSITPSNIIITNINSFKLGNYAEIDITNVVKNAYNNFHGIILESTASKYNSILRFANINSSTPPYILISYTNAIPETTLNITSITSSSIPQEAVPIKTESIIVPPSSNEDINKLKESLNSLEVKFNSLKELINTPPVQVTPSTNDSISEESYNKLTNSVNERITTFDEKLTTFNNLINTANLNYDLVKNNLTQTDETIANLVNHLAEIEVKLASISNIPDFSPMINSLNNSINNLQASLNGIVDKNNSTIETVNSRLTTLENSLISNDLNKISNDLATALNNIKSLEEKIIPLTNGVAELKSQYEALKQQVNLISITPLKLL